MLKWLLTLAVALVVLTALSPWLALWVTAAVAARWPATFRGRWHTLPAFLLTKLAWGWGASSSRLASPSWAAPPSPAWRGATGPV